MTNYTNFIAEIIKKKNVLSKKFYIIVYFSPLELGITKSFLSLGKKTLPFPKSYVLQKAKISLYPKRDHLSRQAGRAGLKLKQLTTSELNELFYDIYNRGLSKDRENLPKSQKPEITDTKEALEKGLSPADLIAPPYLEIDFNHIKIGNTYLRTLYIAGYPRFVSPGWLEPIVNFDNSVDLSFYVYPVSGKSILDDLRRKIAEMEAEIETDLERGKIVDPLTQAKLDDAKALQDELVKGAERFFEFGFYITIPAKNLEELNHTTRQVQATLGSLLIIALSATLDMENGLLTTLPLGQDRLVVTRNMDSTSLATTFPFTSAELSSDTGILYGINTANDSFVIFDRFTLENANSTLFAVSGAGKSFFVKLESIRSLMMGTEIIIIDPESEYKALAEYVGGEFISFSFSSSSKINPFDLSQVYDEKENQLGLKILSLHSLLRVIMGQITPSQDALLDRALVATYRAKGITMDPTTQKRESPLMEDLYKTLIGMEIPEALDMAARVEKFVRGAFVGILDQHTNINLENPFTVFSVKDLQDILRPIAMFVILDYIWTRVRTKLKRRILVVDEAWHMMRYPDTAQFLWSVVKRARKYYLGLTTITQDVEDFLAQDIGKAIVTNSAMRVLLKQSPAAIDKITQTFYLSQGERQLLLAANVGEGIFFAGPHHAPIRVVSSEQEYKLMTTKPQELEEQRKAQIKQQPNIPNPANVIKTSPEKLTGMKASELYR
ncbi:ATP-binding protein [Candidatus Woesebacteria bacterium]|nr:ATP-binding protein [Candidatus Woesebacteria bacterium]